jgi:hypothetical protein
MATDKVRYDGSVCVNVRSIGAICKLLALEGGSAEPLSWSQLSDALWFVETCVTSKNIFFDGTVPQHTATQVLDAVEQLKRGCELTSFHVSAITAASPRHVLDAAGAALAESRPLLEHFAIDPNIDTPLDQDEHENFLGRLHLALSSSPSERESRALDWAADGFRGGKCLAGLIANGDEMLAAARRLYDRHPGQEALITAALINRFRLNYVNHLAASKGSAYVPDPGFEGVTKQHVWLFKDYLIDQLQKQLKVAPDEANIIVANMKSDDPLPPIGLYALMATKATKRPAAILETAYNEFRRDNSLMKMIWENTRGGIALRRGRTAEEYLPKIEQHFYDNYKILEKQAAGIKAVSHRMRPARSYLVPAILKGLVKAIPEVLGVSKLCETVYSVLRETGAEASIAIVSDKLQTEDCDSYLSQYKSLKWDLQDDPAVRVPWATLSEHASRVFGRPLSG